MGCNPLYIQTINLGTIYFDKNAEILVTALLLKAYTLKCSLYK